MLGKRKKEEFLRLLTKLPPLEFLGFCRVMGVTWFNEEEEPLEAEILIAQLVDKYESSSRDKKRRIITILRAAGGVS